MMVTGCYIFQILVNRDMSPNLYSSYVDVDFSFLSLLGKSWETCLYLPECVISLTRILRCMCTCKQTRVPLLIKLFALLTANTILVLDLWTWTMTSWCDASSTLIPFTSMISSLSCNPHLSEGEPLIEEKRHHQYWL